MYWDSKSLPADFPGEKLSELWEHFELLEQVSDVSFHIQQFERLFLELLLLRNSDSFESRFG